MDRERSLILALQRDLALPSEAARFDDARLAQTWADPAGFERALIAWAEAGGARLASSLDRSIALYADCVLRNRASRAPALEYCDERAGWKSVSYAELDAEATRLSSLWRARGVSPKSIVALALDPSPLFFAACFAAWRLGAAVTVLSASFATAIALALDATKATAVVVDPDQPWPLAVEWTEKTLPIRGAARVDTAPPLSFAAEQPALVALSPLGVASSPSKVAARELLVSALRDSALLFSLSSGRRVLAPLLDAAQWYPTLALAAMCVGATLVLVPSRVAMARPQTLAEVSVDVGVLSRAAMALSTTSGVAVAKRWGRVIRCVEESLDWDFTHRFLQRQGPSTPTCNALYDAGAGGAILVGTSRPASVSSRVLAAAGRPWKLEGDSPASAGVFSAKSAKARLTATKFLLARQGTELLYAGTLDARRDGRVYDSDAVLDVIAPWVASRGASFVVDAVDPCTARFALVAFCSNSERSGELRAAITARIDNELGPASRPDAIELYPGFARRKGAKVDVEWVAAQQRAGWLAKKQQIEPYRALATLREQWLAQRAPTE